MRRFIPFLLALSVPLAGCEEDDGTPAPTGTYEVQSHTRTVMTCEGVGEAVEGDTGFFSLELEDFLGASLLGWHDCTSATACEEEASLVRSFVEQGGEWVLRSTFSSGLDACEGTIEEGTAVETDEGVEIEIRTYSGTIQLDSGETCDTDVVDAHQDELDCTSVERIQGRAI